MNKASWLDSERQGLVRGCRSRFDELAVTASLAAIRCGLKQWGTLAKLEKEALVEPLAHVHAVCRVELLARMETDVRELAKEVAEMIENIGRREHIFLAAGSF